MSRKVVVQEIVMKWLHNVSPYVEWLSISWALKLMEKPKTAKILFYILIDFKIQLLASKSCKRPGDYGKLHCLNFLTLFQWDDFKCNA